MKRPIFLIITSALYLCLSFGSMPVFAQQITPKVLPLSKPKIVNFKALADYQRKHPLKHKLRYIEQGEDREHGRTFIPHYVPGNTPVFKASTAERSTGEVSPSPRIVFNGIISN